MQAFLAIKLIDNKSRNVRVIRRTRISISVTKCPPLFFSPTSASLTSRNTGGGGGGVLPYKGLMGTCSQPGYVFRDFCLEQGIEFIIFCPNKGIDLSNFVLNWVKCLKQGIKNRNSVLNRVGISAIFVLNRVRI